MLKSNQYDVSMISKKTNFFSLQWFFATADFDPSPFSPPQKLEIMFPFSSIWVGYQLMIKLF